MGKIVNKILGVKKVDTAGMAFKPYALSTPMGSSYFNTATGTGGYNLSPDLQGMYEQYLAGSQAALPSEQQMQFAGDVSNYGKSLFGTSIGMDTEQMAKDYYNQQQAIMEPTRAQESSRLNDLMFSGGTLGQGVGVSGGGGYINPQQYALQMARENQNAQLATGAYDRARTIQSEDLQRALGYYGLGQELTTQPYQQSANILGYGTGLQQTALPALTYGLQAGQSSAQAGANIAQAQNQQNANTLGFWGSLIGGGMQGYNKPTTPKG
jgi:hypothetical protein